MTEKELRRLKRSELIEILFYMRKELDELKAENERLVQRIDGMSNSTELSEDSVNRLMQGFKSIMEECNGGNAPLENHDTLRKESGEESRKGEDSEKGTVTEQHG